MTDYVEICHSPFARQTLVRELVKTDRTCNWCGRTRKSGKLFRYGHEQDDRPGAISWETALFCSLECKRTYGI